MRRAHSTIAESTMRSTTLAFTMSYMSMPGWANATRELTATGSLQQQTHVSAHASTWIEQRRENLCCSVTTATTAQDFTTATTTASERGRTITTQCKVPHEAGGEQKSVRERHGYLRASHSDASQCCRGTARNDRLEGCAGEGCTHVATSDGASSTR